MKKKMNFWSFIFSAVWILLFFIVSSSGPIDYTVLGIHPLILLLFSTLLTLVIGLIGFSGIENWMGKARSFSTIILTLGLSVFLAIILFFGELLG